MSDESTLIRIRERSFLDLLDLALVVVRHRALPITAAALAGILPFAALNAYLATDPEFPLASYVGLLAIEAPWATAPLTVMLGGLMFGDRPTAGRVVRSLFRALPGMILYQLIIRTVLTVIVILYPIIPTRLAFMNEVLLLERGKTRSAVKRCSTLVGSRGGDFFGQWLGQVLFGVTFIACFWAGTAAIFSALTTNKLTWEEPGAGDFYGFRAQFSVWLVIAFFAVARFLTYIDQRIRLEGWEVKLRLQSVGRSLEESSRW